jgi:formyl-CoA transferase
MPELVGDARFDRSEKRSANRAELNELIAERLAKRTTAEWVEKLSDAGVPAGPVYRMDEVFADPQVRHLGLVCDVEHRTLGTIGLVRNAVTMSEMPPTVRTATPEAGAQTDEILSEIGLTAGEVSALRADGVVA